MNVYLVKRGVSFDSWVPCLLVVASSIDDAFGISDKDESKVLGLAVRIDVIGIVSGAADAGVILRLKDCV